MTAKRRKNHRLSYIHRVIKTDPCAYCGKAGGTKDHIVPMAMNGISNWLNYTGACERCNTRKANNSLLGFLLGTEILGQASDQVEVPRDYTVDNIFHAYPLHSLLGILYYTGQPL